MKRASVSFPRRRPSSVGVEIERRARPAIAGAVVVVPAHDEARLIARCLRSIDRAAARCHVPVTIVVAADRCRDATAGIARAVDVRHAELVVVSGSWRGASAARAAGLRTAIDRSRAAADELWLASTDADGVVPATWLTSQLAHEAVGVDAVAGVVRLAPSAPEHLRRAFAAAYGRGDGPRHVHAANLGVRIDALGRVGGWKASTMVGEEHALWRGLRLAGCVIAHDENLVVTTSHRTHSRVVGGFASRLARLDVMVPGEATA